MYGERGGIPEHAASKHAAANTATTRKPGTAALAAVHYAHFT
jgi:hypothetical protein